MKTSKTPGYRVRELRKERGWTQNELARRAGVSQQNVSDVERGFILSPHTLHLMAQAFRVSTDYLHTGEGPQSTVGWTVAADLEKVDPAVRAEFEWMLAGLIDGRISPGQFIRFSQAFRPDD